LRARIPIVLFAFSGAFLLFTLEPLVGRLLLPRFGGGFHVWTSALMFFQGALFCGYAYAHFFADRVGRWHLIAVLLPIALLPLSLPEPGGDSVLSIVAVLVRAVALPFAVLATSAVVAQKWWRGVETREPFVLYAVSNAGSLGALVLYAAFIDPFVGLDAQRWAWSIGYLLYALIAFVAARTTRPIEVQPARVPLSSLAYWCALSAAPSAFLLAVTNSIALEAGSVPLVWALTLAIYLGSFVIAFSTPREAEPSRVPRSVRHLWPHVAAVGLFFFSGADLGGAWTFAVVQIAVLAVVSLAAHGELYRVRPSAPALSIYYVAIALGGWIGGAFVAVLAPLAFDGLYEYPIALAILALAMGIHRRRELSSWLRSAPRLALALSAALALAIGIKVAHAHATQADAGRTLAVRRSFYGIYRVERVEQNGGVVRDLVSGRTRQGRQREGDRTPLSYYHPNGPLGDALRTLDRPRSIGAIGLGVGAAAGHLGAGERIRFFEIDPAVAELARAHFDYLEGEAAAEIAIGDARLSLERERREGRARYDLLLVDAFSGDAIPTHLLTVEALRLYRERTRHLVLVHVSNRFYDVRGVIAANARVAGLRGAYRVSSGRARGEDPSEYVALARDRTSLRALLANGWSALSSSPRGVAPWTDDRTNLLEALRFF
jgi:hypothetical protein